MSPRTGRPKVENPKEIRFSIRLDENENTKLTEYCAVKNVTRAEAIRQAINKILEEHNEK